MAFPDDYRRVQIAGGVQADVDTQVGLPRQILIDSTNWGIRVMDGNKEGGFPVAMVHQLPDQLQAVIPAGAVAYVEDPAANDPSQTKLLWQSGILRALFLKLADMTDKVNWVIKDTALRASIRQDANLISDCNLAIVSGWYRFIPSQTSNIPAEISPAGNDQYMLLVIRQSSSELTQMILDRSAVGRIWLRSRVAGAFQSWVMSTGVTAGDLATKVSKAGDTMTGKLIARIGELAGAQLNLRNGVAPTVKVDGDIWREDATGGIMFQKGGVTRQILDSSVGSSILFDHEYASTGIFTKDPNWPADSLVQVEYVSGGGGGGASQSWRAGGGGGGVWYQEFRLSDLGSNENVIVGAGGAANADGGSSSFAGIEVRGGSAGGSASSAGTANGGSGGSLSPTKITLSGFTPGFGNVGAAGGVGGSGNAAPGVASKYAPAGGGATAGGVTAVGGISTFYGNGGAANNNGVYPGGGGGANASGARGRIKIRVVR